MTRSQLQCTNLSGDRHKNVDTIQSNQIILPWNQKIPHLKSFPSMYNTWGPNRLEVGQKNSLSKKTSSKLSFLLTTFSYHPSLGSRHSQICHMVIVFKVTHCFPLILCFKMSYWEVIRNFKSLSYKHFPKMCCLPPKMSSNAFFFKNTSLS